MRRPAVIVALLAMVMAIVARFGDRIDAWAVTHQDIATVAAIGVGLLILLVLGISWGSVIFAVVVVASRVGVRNGLAYLALGVAARQ